MDRSEIVICVVIRKLASESNTDRFRFLGAVSMAVTDPIFPKGNGRDLVGRFLSELRHKFSFFRALDLDVSGDGAFDPGTSVLIIAYGIVGNKV
jgi:hypothetical protein